MNERAEGIKHSEQLYNDLVCLYHSREAFDIRDSLGAIEEFTYNFSTRRKNKKLVVNSDAAIQFHLKSFDIILEVLDHMMDWNVNFANQRRYFVCHRDRTSLRNVPWKDKYGKYEKWHVTTRNTVSYLGEMARVMESSKYNIYFIYHFLSLFAIRFALLNWFIHDSKRTQQIFLSTLSNGIFQRNSSDYSSLNQLLKEIRTRTCIVCMGNLGDQEFCIRDSCKHLICKECTLTLMEKQHDA